MSDFGAEVIKVEPRSAIPIAISLPFRRCPSRLNYLWLLDGRNKKSVSLDLTTDEGRDILLKLVATADVFITNYQPSILRKLRLNYEDIAAVNPRVIYASATGYGERGAETESPGFDMTAYWARSGLMDAVHNEDAEPAPSTCGMGDHPSAMSLLSAILLALYNRLSTGKGTKVSTSLAANGAWSNACLIQSVLCGAEPYAKPSRAEAINPMVNHYRTRDGKRFIFCQIQPEKDWGNLCRALDRPELISDPELCQPGGPQRAPRRAGGHHRRGHRQPRPGRVESDLRRTRDRLGARANHRRSGPRPAVGRHRRAGRSRSSPVRQAQNRQQPAGC